MTVTVLQSAVVYFILMCVCELCGVSDSEPDVSKAHLSDEWSDSRSEGRGGRLTWCCRFCIVTVWQTQWVLVFPFLAR